MSQTTRLEEKSMPVLYMALELGWSKWVLGFARQRGEKPRQRTLAARDLEALRREIELARTRLGLPTNSRVISCYEAGRDGFWLHRCLLGLGVENLVVDSSSIEVSRRARHAKSDGLDVQKLLALLIRYDQGERKVWSVVRVPSPQEEDARQPHRELEELKAQRTELCNRMRGLLASQGLDPGAGKKRLARWPQLLLWDGSEVGSSLRARLEREQARLEMVEKQIRVVEAQRREQLERSTERTVEMVRHLKRLRSIGPASSWLLVRELFGWRQFQNRRQLAALAGLAPTPRRSGDSLDQEQGIVGGNGRVRRMMIEIAWLWQRLQPRSQLSLWFKQRFAGGNGRSRRVGIVALARKLLVALWRYCTTGEIPEGAELKPA